MRRLVLYSNQVPPLSDKVDEQLLKLIGKLHPTIGYIPSCSDPGRFYFLNRQAYYARYNIRLPVYFELDISYRPDLLEALFACDAIHLSGGNTYYFLHWLRERNLISRLQQYVEQGGILIGVSAGSILMTPDITTTDLCGDTPPEHPGDVSGLNLVEFAFVPHIEKIALSSLLEYARQHQVTLYGCRDEDGIVVDDHRCTLVGNVVKIVNGTLFAV